MNKYKAWDSLYKALTYEWKMELSGIIDKLYLILDMPSWRNLKRPIMTS